MNSKFNDQQKSLTSKLNQYLKNKSQTDLSINTRIYNPRPNNNLAKDSVINLNKVSIAEEGMSGNEENKKSFENISIDSFGLDLDKPVTAKN